MDDKNQLDRETICEFLVESHENLSRLEQDLVQLEKHPHDAALLGSIFRTFHTIKGACGFLAFSTLEKITHEAETLLSQLRDGQRELTPALISLILETVDATRKVLASIEAQSNEGDLRFEDLTRRLRLAASSDPVPEPASADVSKVEVAKKKTRVEEDDYARPSAADANIRVGVLLLDKLMDLVGELVLARNQILQFSAEREDAKLNATSQRLNLITSELQESVMKTRMQPIGVAWSNLPRVVRDMAVSLGKQIQLKMDGADTELDRTIIEAIKDPLIHLVRNSCDHGVELPAIRAAAGKPAQGTMTLRAYHEGGQVNIEVSDDGAGIDIACVRKKRSPVASCDLNRLTSSTIAKPSTSSSCPASPPRRASPTYPAAASAWMWSSPTSKKLAAWLISSAAPVKVAPSKYAYLLRLPSSPVSSSSAAVSVSLFRRSVSLN
jgi:two-component system chemotaxis sensor kinase CheA